MIYVFSTFANFSSYGFYAYNTRFYRRKCLESKALTFSFFLFYFYFCARGGYENYTSMLKMHDTTDDLSYDYTLDFFFFFPSILYRNG